MRFVLVDEIVEMVPGTLIRASKVWSPDEELFADHFPGFPTVPGVLLTEMMAQAAGACLEAESEARGRAMLAQIKNATFREWVRPGQAATIVCSIRSSLAQVATASCYVEVDGRQVCSAELLFSFLPADRFAADVRGDLLARYRASHP